jgi:hypothetical protein
VTEDYPKLRAFVRAHPNCAPGSIAFYFDAAVVNCSCGAQFVEPMNGSEAQLGIRLAVQSEASKIQSPLHDEVLPSLS